MFISLEALSAVSSASSVYFGLDNSGSGCCYTMPTDITISSHAFQRFRERTDFLTDEEICCFVEEAVEFGRDPTSYSGIYRQFLEERACRGCLPMTYRGLLLLFSPDRATLVTVYPLPTWFFKELPLAHVRGEKWYQWRNRCTDVLRGIWNRLASWTLRANSCVNEACLVEEPVVLGSTDSNIYDEF